MCITELIVGIANENANQIFRSKLIIEKQNS